MYFMYYVVPGLARKGLKRGQGMQRLLSVVLLVLTGPVSPFSGLAGRIRMSPPTSNAFLHVYQSPVLVDGATTTPTVTSNAFLYQSPVNGETPTRTVALSLSPSSDANNGVDFESLLDMDVVLFRRRNSEKGELELGAMQEDGTVAPISAWSLESAFASGASDSIEFLVDEEDRFPGLTADDIVIVSVVDESLISYGSRQVGGGKGPGNPHGEESELLYYVERSVVEEETIQVVIKPELEILW